MLVEDYLCPEESHVVKSWSTAAGSLLTTEWLDTMLSVADAALSSLIKRISFTCSLMVGNSRDIIDSDKSTSTSPSIFWSTVINNNNNNMSVLDKEKL